MFCLLLLLLWRGEEEKWNNMEIPSQTEAHFDVITTGVESEEVEEVNDAYKDILEELGDWITNNRKIVNCGAPFYNGLIFVSCAFNFMILRAYCEV